MYVDALDHAPPVAGEPGSFLIEDGEPTTWSAWNVAGPLRLGSGMTNGSTLWPFHGAIDEVRIADGHIIDESTLDNICLGSDVS
ncbi:hypothetical protein [Promicromonospora sp. NPDC023805]|uniref:hypothetical protein n=1 Tax=Promicromonospora sp. NPDC023805 TaxID=3154696 RepID=UPI0033F2450E